jgi:hypothetical protein
MEVVGEGERLAEGAAQSLQARIAQLGSVSGLNNVPNWGMVCVCALR